MHVTCNTCPRCRGVPVAFRLQELLARLLRLDLLVGVLHICHDTVERAQLPLAVRTLIRTLSHLVAGTPLEEGERLAVRGVALVDVAVGAEAVRRCAHRRRAILRLGQEVARCVDEREADEDLTQLIVVVSKRDLVMSVVNVT